MQIHPRKFRTTIDELQRYAYEFREARTDLHLCTFRRVLIIEEKHPQKIFDTYYALGQFTNYKLKNTQNQ
jgi:hypothetical protein